jgi:hypothetical protein
MKRILKKINDILDRRVKAAQDFIKADKELVEWMNENRVDITHYKLKDYILCGCEIIVNHEGSKESIIDFLNCW